MNTDNIILMGSSAGAIIVSQLGTIISNPEYASLLNISPVLKPEQIKVIVVDDAPLDYKSFSLGCKFLIGNYVNGSIFLNEKERSCYDCIPHMTENYPVSIMLGSEYRFDMNEMHDKLDKLGVENVLIDPYAEKGEKQPHCFVSNERKDATAKDAFDRLMTFLNTKTQKR